MNRDLFFVISIIFVAATYTSLYGEHVKVDFDARYDATASGFLSWQITDGATNTFGDVTVSLRFISPPAYNLGKIGWYNKDGLNNYELAMDCLYFNYDDGTQSHPSFQNVSIQLTLTGLTEGAHTLITYHNCLWPVSKYDRTAAPCKIYIDGTERLTVQPSQYVNNDNDIESTFLTFTATEAQPVVIIIEPFGDEATQICTALLNGFEIDNLASVDSYAAEPVPSDGDMHVFANNDDPTDGSYGNGYTQLSWTPSDFATLQDVYFGSDETSVTNADINTAGIYKGRQSGAESTLDVTDLNSKDTYYWRIDTIKADASITKGNVWSFRTRHLAYSSADGYGRFARGGRYGRVVEVTTLDDYNSGSEPVIEGSLRKAIEVEKGPRVVVFKVGGTIFLKGKLVIPSDGGDVYVAGQTAPGEGICVARYPFGMLGAKDAIIRFVRTRVGDYAQISLDGMGLASSDHCIIDHCSISWSIDEGHSSRGAKNTTFSYNIISEALNHSYQYANHSFAASISGGIGSYHHNLLAHCTGRNWSLAGGLGQSGQYDGHCDIRNNVVYNWKDRTTDGGVFRCNFVNNYYIPGPVTTLFLLMRPDGDQMGTGNPQKFYITGNKLEGYPQYDADNWVGVAPNYATKAEIRSDVPFFPPYAVTESIEDMYSNVLNNVGAIRPRRDAIDTRVINDVLNRSFTYRGSIDNLPGIIDSQDDVGGYPVYASGPVPDDTDRDGLPNWWEELYGMNPDSAIGDYSDTNADPDQDGFTNMDDYLEYLAQGGNPFYKCSSAITADLNDNCEVDVDDYAIFASDWLKGKASPVAGDIAADLDDNSQVDLLDFALFAAGWLNCNKSPASECW